MVGYGWKTTIELEVSDQIETDGFDAMAITHVIDQKRQDLTYNFTVADFHTYYVTKKNLLVHNCGLNPKPSAFGEKIDGSPIEVKNAVSEAKVHKILGNSNKANCAKCKLETSINSRTKEQKSFENQGRSKSSEEYKTHQNRIDFEQKQLDELN